MLNQRKLFDGTLSVPLIADGAQQLFTRYQEAQYTEAQYFCDLAEMDTIPEDRLVDTSADKSERLFLLRNAQILETLQGRFTHQISQFFEPYYKKYIFDEEETLEDAFDKWMIAIYSHTTTAEKPLLEQIAENDAAVSRIGLYFSEPELYSPWQVGFGKFDNWGHCARGRLIQFHEARHGEFETWNDLDVVVDGAIRHNNGLDFQSATDKGVFAEMKTTAAGKVDHLRDSLENSVQEVIARGGSELAFKIFYLESNGVPNMASLNKKLAKLRLDNEELSIKIDLIASPFKPY